MDQNEMRDMLRLAMLEIPDEGLEALTADMAGIVAFADAVRTLPVCTPEESENTGLPPREDRIRPSFDRGALLAAAGGGEDGFFTVPDRREETL